jgi:plasmid stability protein
MIVEFCNNDGTKRYDVLTLKRSNVKQWMEVMTMSETAKRSTVYLEPELHRALRIKAIHARRSMSDIVNDAVREALREDAEDLAAFDERADEPTLSYEELLKDLRAHGKI